MKHLQSSRDSVRVPFEMPRSRKKSSSKVDRESTAVSKVPKLVQIQCAQFLNHLLEYASELTYFAINAFQSSSLRRVQMNTLQRFSNFCVPRTCAFYYNLDTEFEHFVQRMRLLCGLAKRTFLDIRVTRIHSSSGRMSSLPATRRSIEIFKCNIHRLRDLKEIHQGLGYDLLLPDEQLYLALDLLVTDFELLNCELDAEVKFADAMILQTIIRDIFLQYRLALTWIYPAVKHAAYRPDDSNIPPEMKKCHQLTHSKRPEHYCGRAKARTASVHFTRSSSVGRLYPLPRNSNRDDDASESNSDRSARYRKKRKRSAMKIVRLSPAHEDFNQYLHRKQLDYRGVMCPEKLNSTPTRGQRIMERLRSSVASKKKSLRASPTDCRVSFRHRIRSIYR